MARAAHHSAMAQKRKLRRRKVFCLATAHHLTLALGTCCSAIPPPATRNVPGAWCMNAWGMMHCAWCMNVWGMKHARYMGRAWYMHACAQAVDHPCAGTGRPCVQWRTPGTAVLPAQK
eukprot:364072-Chlamydomonas_euryale.AAC.12